MGVLPLLFEAGENAESLRLDGSESFTITGISDITPRKRLAVKAEKSDGHTVTFTVTARLDSEVEVAYFQNGGILPFVLRKMLGAVG
jgi:aconitate hydratase